MEIHPNVDDLEYYTIIKVIDKHRTTIEWLKYVLPFRLSVKYNWYFRYRHALLQVKYPKLEVITHHSSVLKKEPDLQKNLDMKIRKAKGKITEMKNKLARARIAAEKELFGIEDEPIVIEYKKKIEKAENDLLELQNLSLKDFYIKFKDRYPNIDIEKL